MAIAGALLPALIGAGATIATSFMGSKTKKQELPGLPKSPDPSEEANRAQEMANRRRAMTSKTVYSSPLGTKGQAQVARKTLLGQ